MNVEERFLKYVSFETTSDENSSTCPSSPKELILGKYIAEDMRNIGLKSVKIDKDGYVYGFLPASKGAEKEPSIGFIAHMDTSPDVSGANIKPKKIKYKGGDIQLNKDVAIKRSVFPFLDKYKGQTLIVTDGTTLLGGDDKAGAAEILTAMEYLSAHPEIKHGKICVGITPDEEIGRGADRFNIKAFGADFAYTVDGGDLGQINYENFNAAGAKFTVNGINIHPGSAKDKMKNAVLIANELISMLPPAETPGHTEKYEGFYHVAYINGDESKTELGMIIRDHDMKKFKERKKFTEKLAAYLNEKYGKGTVVLDMHDSYFNMKEKIKPVIHIIERAEKAYKDAGVESYIEPIRGGTDGARLSFDGLPCPNLSTGGENFHGVHEFVSLDAMEKMVEVITNIAKA